MSKRVLDIGQCDPDHSSIRRYLTEKFDAEIDRAEKWEDAEPKLRSDTYDLVLVNRKLDVDYSDGLDIIKKVKGDPDLQSTPMMLVTNFADHQDVAVAAGAERGFGKSEFDAPETYERLHRFLT